MNTDCLRHGVNQQVLNDSGQLARKFASAQPFRHVMIDDFFTPDLCRQLSETFPPFDEELAVDENGNVANKAVHERILDLGPAWQNLDELVQHESFRDLISRITGIPDLQYDPHYYGGGTHENRHGQGMDAHIDFNIHPITRQHRRLNLIVYLNEEWKEEWGGSIQLHKDPHLPPAQEQVISITPRFNRCVIFETNEYSWHGFPRVDLPEDKRGISRRSFALYYYTDTRPEEETSTEHSTIYVDEHLSDSIRAGTELSTDQLQHIQVLLGSRDQHIKRLYDNIKQVNAVYNELRAYHSEQQADLASLREEHQKLCQMHASALADTRAAVEKNTTDNEKKAEYIRQKDRVIRNLEQKIKDMETSTSWRLTGPVRRVKRMFRKN